MNVCVFCGSSTGLSEIYSKAAHDLGGLLAAKGHSLVYGGGNVGLMGIVADSVLMNQGTVIGVIPDFLLQREVGHRNITKLEVVGTMHERKARMAELADAFVAIPGGWGTLDELAEILTWKQLLLVQQPVVLLNLNYFFDGLLQQMHVMVEEGFLRRENLALIQLATSPQEVVDLLSNL
jgi:uncharacterized protein (TIGR00730 family)